MVFFSLFRGASSAKLLFDLVVEGGVQSWIVGFVSPGFEGRLQSLLGFSVLGLSSQVVDFPGIARQIVELELGRFGEGVEGLADVALAARVSRAGEPADSDVRRQLGPER